MTGEGTLPTYFVHQEAASLAGRDMKPSCDDGSLVRCGREIHWNLTTMCFS